MTGFDHENAEKNENNDISFNVEDNTTGVLGEPVFASDDELSNDLSQESPSQPDFDAKDQNDLEDALLEELSSDLSSELDVEEALVSSADDEVAMDECSEDNEETEAQEESGVTPLEEELTLFGKIEAIIFASPKPMRAVEIHDLLTEQGYTLKEVQDACDELIEFYRDRAGGVHLKYIKRMGYQFQTTTAAKSLMEKQFASRPRPLSRAALETLAVIAYRQKLSKGVTRAEVEFIRGVDAGSIFKTLVERNLLACIGRKEIPGRPMLFGVTDEFLKIFQLGSINDLPPLESFQTPQDVLDAANQKIADFEDEQAGVDTEKFVADDEYSESVRGEGDFNPLTADAPTFAPAIEAKDPDAIHPGADASALQDGSTDVDDCPTAAAEQTSDDLEESQADLIDVLNEGQVAWTASPDDNEDRTIQGATAGSVISSVDAIDEREWGDVKPVETTDNESDQSVPMTVQPFDDQSDEALLNERDATTEVALPTGDSQPPRGGEVDQ
jgi:segregation and condensation protein B